MVDIAQSTQSRLIGIGNLCNQWSYVEHLLAKAIWHFLKLTPEGGRIIAGGMDIGVRAQIAIELAQHLEAEQKLIDALTSARASIESLRSERNLTVHGVYFLNSNTGDVFVEAPRGKNRGVKQSMSTQRIHELGDKVHVTANSLRAALLAAKIDVT